MATLKQRKAVKKLVENGGNISLAMRQVGYSPATAQTPQKLTESKGWKELMDEHLNDADLAKLHEELLASTRLDHMVFPDGPVDDHEVQKFVDADMAKAAKEGKEYVGKDYMTDDDIKHMLKSVNCTVRRIVHGEIARHVYFWAADNRARKEGLDMAYKLKGKYAPEKTVNLNIDVETTLTEEDKALIEVIREHDRTTNRNTRAETVAATGNVSDGVDAQS